MKTPSPARAEELERLLRRLRQQCLTNDHAADLIPKVKRRLEPHWKARIDARPYYHPFYACE